MSNKPGSDGAARYTILGVFVVSRVLYFLKGVRFQTEQVGSNFQFIDIELMKHRLMESLYYDHVQPPLHNLMTGSVVKAFPQSYGTALHVLFMAMGLASALLLFQLMRDLGTPTAVAAVLTIVFITSPGCVLFENYPMYEYPMMLLILGQCVALTRLLERPRFATAAFFFSLLAALALVRATYHLYYLIAVAAFIAWFTRNARLVVAAATLPFLAVLAIYVKNLAVFGFFGASSWMGNNMPTITTHNLTAEECSALVQEGKLDPFGCVDGGQPPDVYRRWVPGLAKTGIPLLDDEWKSTGAPNMHHAILLKTGPLYLKAARQSLRYAPGAYLRSLGIAWFCYFRPPSDFFQFEQNRAHIQGLERVYDLILFGELRQASGKELRAIRAREGTAALFAYTGVLLIVSIPAILIGAFAAAWRDFHAGKNRNRAVLILFVLAQILLVMVIFNFLSSFENNRYRFPTDALYVALAGFLIARMWRRRSTAVA